MLLFASDIDRRDVEQLRALPGVEGIGYLRQLAVVPPRSLISLATVVIANVVAAFPARTAARTEPAFLLQNE